MKFIKGIFSNDDGTPSSNRVFLFIILCAIISWANMIVCKTCLIPVIPDCWLYLVGIFSGVVIGTKVTAAVQAVKGAGNVATSQDISAGQ